MGNTILITEDEKSYLRSLSQYFTLLGFTVYSATNCRDTIRLAAEHLPDCFLLDYNLGDETAAPACLFIRSHAQLKSAPIIVLSGAHEMAEECYNNCNADLFLEKGKPFTEVGAAVKRQLRRIGVQPSVKSSDIVVCEERLSITREGYSEILLSAEQFKLFLLLFRRSPGFVSEDEICSAVLGADCACKREAINMLVYRLRSRLGPRLGKRIKSKKRLGWAYVQPRVRGEAPPKSSGETAIR